MPRPATTDGASALIDARIAQLDDWRGVLLARIRALIHEAVPTVVEEWKWRGTPVWSSGGILCTGEVYQQTVKMTFAKGAFLPDPQRMFNASLEGNVRRAIDFRAGDAVDEQALRALLQAAALFNAQASAARRTGRGSD